MTYRNTDMEAAIDALMAEDATPEQVEALSQDLSREYRAAYEAEAERCWESARDAEAIAARHHAHDDALRDAGRGHLIRG